MNGSATDSMWIAVFRLLGLAVAGAFCVWLLTRVQRIGPVQCAAIAMMATVLLGPVVWPWYLAPSIALLGAAGVGRWRPALLVLTIAFAFEVFPVGPQTRPVLEGSHVVSLGLIVLIAVLTVASPFVIERWRRRELPPTDDMVGFAPAD